MIRWVSRRIGRTRSDEGAYAVLYAILVVVILSFAAMVIDLAQVREDRRGDRVLADNAALAGADHLSLLDGIKPYTACTTVLKYLGSQWGVATVPLGSCSVYQPYEPLTAACNTVIPAPVPFTPVTLGSHTISLAWPVPDSSPFMTSPDVKPGSVAQSTDSVVDGTNPCLRLAVQISMSQGFSFATVFGATGTVLSDASVAINRLKAGNPNDIAALNVLNPHTCDAVTTSGQGEILVDKTVDPATGQSGPGIIAVESDGHPTSASSNCPNNSPYVIDPNTNTASWICASGPGSGAVIHSATTSLGTPVSCNGNGSIESHALDVSNGANSFNPARVTANLAPTPVPEGGTAGVKPVTDLYGCATVACPSSTPIQQLVTAYGGAGQPTTAYAGVDNAFKFTAFQTLNDGDLLSTKVPAGVGTFQCNSGSFYVPPGNWYVNCPDKLRSPGFQANKAVFGGGTIVFAGSVQASNGDIAFNVPLGSANTSLIGVTGTGASVTTTPGPLLGADAVVYIRGTASVGGNATVGALNGSGSYALWAPQTFIFLGGGSPGFISFGAQSTSLVWTDPQTLDCASSDTTCQEAGFKKLVLWSECSCSGGTAQQLGGQGQTYLLGVFFTPYSEFDFTGQATYASGAAQVWADTLSMKGQGAVILQPDPDNAVKRPTSSSGLIR
jgi:hypothetical protein